MIGAIVPYVNKIRRSYECNDLIDRLNYQYTGLMVGLAAMTLAATQYVGKPIQCWVPAQFTGSWEKYSETLCFIKGSYYIPDDTSPEAYFVSEEKKTIGYYQWVPLVLAIQAFLYFFPSLLWRAFNDASGINVKDVLESAAKIKKNLTAEESHAMVIKAATHMREALELQRELKVEAAILSKLRKSGFFLSLLYLFTKVLYVLNIFLQFFIFTTFLAADNSMWGWDVFTDLVNGRSWAETGNFPRVTMCDFNVRVVGSVHRWTVQCVLMINMYTEKIYVFLWFWFFFLGILTVISCIYWTIALSVSNCQRELVLMYLRCNRAISARPSREEEHKVSSFVTNYLTADGVFIIRMVQLNGGDGVAGKLTAKMYEMYLERYETPRADSSIDSPDTTATLPR